MFRAIRVDEPAENQPNVFILKDLGLDALMSGEVVVDVEFSSINYKDALAIAGRPGIIREYPLHPRHRPRRHRLAQRAPRLVTG